MLINKEPLAFSFHKAQGVTEHGPGGAEGDYNHQTAMNAHGEEVGSKDTVQLPLERTPNEASRCFLAPLLFSFMWLPLCAYWAPLSQERIISHSLSD